MHATPRPRAWFREPMLWLVVGLPALAVAAAIAALVLAIRSGGSDAVADVVQRTAQIQTAALDADARAQQLGLSAVLRIGSDHIEVLPATGAFARGQALRLRLVHPTSATADRELVLRPSALGWRAEGVPDPGHAWQLQLTPADAAWRLRGRLPARARAAHLGSAFADE
jgi:hypothetical protein